MSIIHGGGKEDLFSYLCYNKSKERRKRNTLSQLEHDKGHTHAHSSPVPIDPAFCSRTFSPCLHLAPLVVNSVFEKLYRIIFFKKEIGRLYLEKSVWIK